jgi:hypothetical protein
MATVDDKGSVDPKKAEELAKAMQAAKFAADAAAQSFQRQLDIVSQLRDAMSEMSATMEKMSQCDTSTAFAPDKLRTYAKSSKEIVQVNTGMLGAFKKLAIFLQGGWSKAVIIGTAALTGLHQGFKNLVAASTSIYGVFAGIADGAFSIGKSILSIPFKLMDGLFKMAENSGGTELQQALENIRKEFGSFKSVSSSAILTTAKSMKGFSDTGLNTFRVFGNVAQKMEAVLKLATEMGPQFEKNADEFRDNGGALLAYQKGLGLSGEQMQSVGNAAMRMGVPMSKVLNDTTKQAQGMAKAFGLDAKVISRDMGKALQDLSHFGHLSSKEMSIAATYANKLGISIDKLTGVMDATSTFDQAAESMSKLNETFGTNIDATKIMSAQNPAEKLEILRKEFAKTGKDMAHLTFQERMLIKQNTGLEYSTLDAAFASKNMGVSLDKISKQAGVNEKKTLTQADAMHELSSSIERMVQEAPKSGGGIFDKFIDGITKGIMSTGPFIALMKNINIVFREATISGVTLGKKLVTLFPGVNKIFTSLGDLFNPAHFSKLFAGILKSFDVFDALGSGKFEDFMDGIKKSFFDFFDDSKSSGKNLLDGFKTFGMAIVKIIGKIGEWAIPKIADAITSITEWIKNPKLPNISGEGTGLTSTLMKPLEGSLNALKDKLVPALKELATTIFEKLKEELNSPTGHKLIAGALLTFFGPSAVQSVSSLIVTSLAKSVGKMMLEGITGAFGVAESGSGAAVGKSAGFFEKTMASIGNIVSKGGGKIASGFAKVGEVLGPAFGKAIPVIGWGVLIADAAISVSSATKKFGDDLVKDGTEPAIAKIASGFTGLTNAITLGLLPEDIQSKIAKAVAGLATTIFGQFDAWFGSGFSNSIKEYAGGLFDFIGGFGELLSSMWNGDSSGVDAAFTKMGTGIWHLIEGMFKTWANLITGVMPKIVSWIYNGAKTVLEKVGSIVLALLKGGANAILKFGPIVISKLAEVAAIVFNKLGDIFSSLKDIPILGYLLNTIGKVLKEVGELFDTASKGWKLIFEDMKKFDIGKWIDESITGIKEFIGKIKTWGSEVFDKLTKPFSDVVAEIKKIFSWDSIKSVFENLVSAVKEKLAGLADIGPFKAVIAIAEKAFQIRSPSKVFSDMGSNIKDAFIDQVDKIPGSAEKAFGKTVDATQALMSFDAIKSSPDSISKFAGGITENNIEDIAKRITSIGEMITNAKGTSTAIMTLTSQFEKVSRAMERLGGAASVIRRAGEMGMVDALSGITAMVSNVQQMDNSLASLPKIKMEARLKEVAGKLGLGSHGVYSVQSKDVIINVELKVVMDVDKVEQVIIGRHESIIRDRINFAIRNSSGEGNPLTANALIKSQGPNTGVDTGGATP